MTADHGPWYAHLDHETGHCTIRGAAVRVVDGDVAAAVATLGFELCDTDPVAPFDGYTAHPVRPIHP